MSSLVTAFDSFFSGLDNLSQLFDDSDWFPENQARVRPTAATDRGRRNPPIEKINWDKYSEEVRAEYAAIKNIWLQGVEVETRKISNLTCLHESLLKFQKLVEENWQDFTSYDKKTLEIVAQEILKGSEIFNLDNLANTSTFLRLRIFWVVFTRMMRNSFKPNSLFNFRRLKALRANWELINPKTTSISNESVTMMVSLANSLMDLCNMIVRLAQQEREGKEPPFYETATPEEWSRAFDEWSDSHLIYDTPPLSDEAVSREGIYEERG